MSNRLLVMSCSERKKRLPGSRPAYEVYDGPAFRVVRKWAQEFPQWQRTAPHSGPYEQIEQLGLRVVIVSALHGPILWDTRIEYYDEKLTREKALEVRGIWPVRLKVFAEKWQPSAAMIYGGEVYKLAVPVTRWQPQGCAVELATGGMGHQLQQLKRWLGGSADAGGTEEIS